MSRGQYPRLHPHYTLYLYSDITPTLSSIQTLMANCRLPYSLHTPATLSPSLLTPSTTIISPFLTITLMNIYNCKPFRYYIFQSNVTKTFKMLRYLLKCRYPIVTLLTTFQTDYLFILLCQKSTEKLERCLNNIES